MRSVVEPLWIWTSRGSCCSGHPTGHQNSNTKQSPPSPFTPHLLCFSGTHTFLVGWLSYFLESPTDSLHPNNYSTDPCSGCICLNPACLRHADPDRVGIHIYICVCVCLAQVSLCECCLEACAVHGATSCGADWFRGCHQIGGEELQASRGFRTTCNVSTPSQGFHVVAYVHHRVAAYLIQA